MDTKQCNKCGATKSVNAFHKNRTKRDGLCGECAECASAKARAHYVRHRNQRTAQVRAYHSEHCEKHRAYNQLYYSRHREAIASKRVAQQAAYRAEHRERYSAYVKAWSKANPDKVRAKTIRRRALKRAARGNFTANDLKRQGECQKWKCWWCGKQCKKSYHADHLIPLAKGGHNDPSNIVIACPACNLSKSDKLPSEFAGKLF
jgi:5-methylcytosine-specific restriction endonuclease McrA